MGIGFAIPVDTVRRVVNELIRYGAVVRPTLGINVADDQTTRGLFAQLGLPLGGVLVMSVAPRSPAAVAGLQPTARDGRGQLMLGDLVTEVGGAPVRQSRTCSARSRSAGWARRCRSRCSANAIRRGSRRCARSW